MLFQSLGPPRACPRERKPQPLVLKEERTAREEEEEVYKGTCGKRKDQIAATKSSGLNEGVWDVGWVFTRGFLAERKFCVPQKSSPGER